ncbi:MAG: DPP IV N-terminal domain-containing protein [Bacteroidales bacterium]|nr:DPP IV N-terminal domain-containing protein [Bacteroidales bacterium]
MSTKKTIQKIIYGTFLFILCFVFINGSEAQNTDPGILTLDRIFTDREFTSERFGPARWLDDGTGYTTLEAPTDGEGRDLVKYDPKTGKREILVHARQLVPEGKEKPLRIANYAWSPGGDKLLVFTNTKRVWRQNTRGDYWVLDLSSGGLKQLGAFAKPSTLMFAKFSPDGKKAGYVVENNIYVEDLATGKVIQLTHDGSETLINGTFDWVYEEEFSLRDGFRWSPDSRLIAYWQLDASGVREFYLINNTDSLYSFIIPIQYPKVGEKLSACKVGVISAEGGKTTWMKVKGDPRNNYIARMEWAASSDEIIFQYLNRHQNTIKLMLGNAETGEVNNIYTEKDEAWLNVVDDLKWMDNGKSFAWISEHTGWRHVYLVSRDGQSITPVTKGAYDVISVQNIDEKGGYVYFIASPDNPTQRYLFRAGLSGKGDAERLTPVDQPGYHSYQVSPDFKWAIHTFTNTTTPRTIDLIDLPEHKPVRMLAENKELKEKMAQLKVSPVEFFRVDIGDGVELDGWMIKPYDFDPEKKYPVLFYVYSEPAGQTVIDRPPSLWHLMLAQKGYIIASVDNRGTPAPRGRDWRKCVYMQIGILSSADQAKAAKIISKWDFVDENRIAIWGWSGGGSGTLNAILRYPDIYHTGMSVAPVPDQRYYDAIYQERYMRTPEENPEGFEKGSPLTFAENLKGNLLIVHGTGDDNVHFQGTEALINELIKHNKHFTMMAYPNRSHGIREGKGTTRHLYGLLTRYLLENMPPGTL